VPNLLPRAVSGRELLAWARKKPARCALWRGVASLLRGLYTKSAEIPQELSTDPEKSPPERIYRATREENPPSADRGEAGGYLTQISPRMRADPAKRMPRAQSPAPSGVRQGTLGMGQKKTAGCASWRGVAGLLRGLYTKSAEIPQELSPDPEKSPPERIFGATRKKPARCASWRGLAGMLPQIIHQIRRDPAGVVL